MAAYTMQEHFIHPKGDLLLECRNASIRVSSGILSTISPVFCAMFKPHFKEGLSVRAANPDNPTTIRLPDDDPEALTLLCVVAHYRGYNVPNTPSPDCLEQLAMLVDKYQCKEVVAFHGAIWLCRNLAGLSKEDLSQMLFFAYVLDLPREFLVISKQILLEHVGLFKTLTPLTDNPLVSDNIVAELNTRRDVTGSLINEIVTWPINRMARFRCPRAIKSIGSYVQQLEHLCAMPGTDLFRHLSLGKAFDRAALALARIHIPQAVGSNCGCGCPDMSDFAKVAANRLKRSRGIEFGVCLDCLRSRGESFRKGLCRYSHPGTELMVGLFAF